jgi:hypothetical protein
VGRPPPDARGGGAGCDARPAARPRGWEAPRPSPPVLRARHRRRPRSLRSGWDRSAAGERTRPPLSSVPKPCNR